MWPAEHLSLAMPCASKKSKRRIKRIGKKIFGPASTPMTFSLRIHFQQLNPGEEKLDCIFVHMTNIISAWINSQQKVNWAKCDQQPVIPIHFCLMGVWVVPHHTRNITCNRKNRNQIDFNSKLPFCIYEYGINIYSNIGVVYILTITLIQC